jgi:hypothetical protein
VQDAQQDERHQARWLNKSACPVGIPAGLVVLTLGLAACGGGGGDGGPPVVTPPPAPAISFDPAATTFRLDRWNFQPTSNLYLTVRNTTVDKLFLSGSYSRAAITLLRYDARDPDSIRVIISHRSPATLFNGTFTDTIRINACLDAACSQPLSGSPLTIPITTILAGTDPRTGASAPVPDLEVPPLDVTTRVTLSHDVVDAEYSRTLDRVVMASAAPSSALKVFDPVTGTEQSIPLSKAPTAVAIAPDGLTVAVGHHGAVSVLTLAPSGPQPAAGPNAYSVAMSVFDIAIDARNRVHYIRDGYDIPDALRTLDLATRQESANLLITPQVWSESYIRLHPGGDFLFLQDPLISPASIVKWDVTGTEARHVKRATLDAAQCGKLWFDESGSRVVSQCGNVAATDGPEYYLPQVAMIDTSRTELSYYFFKLEAFDHSSAADEIAYFESNIPSCDSPEFAEMCYPRFGVADGTQLTRKSLHKLPPIELNGTLHSQRGMFVFFDTSGRRKILLTRLDSVSEPDRAFLVSTLE